MSERITTPAGQRWDSQHARWVPVATSLVAPEAKAAPIVEREEQRPIVLGATVGGFMQKMHGRMYASARSSRLNPGWQTQSSSADGELSTSLTALRSRSRGLVRDAAYAKRARVIVQNNVIGSGMGMQAQVRTTRDVLNQAINDDIEETWERWCCGKSCHTGGELHFGDLERAAMGQVFECGEVFIRKYYRLFGDSTVPYALELIEPERIADAFPTPNIAAMVPQAGNLLRMGVEVDPFFRPVAYWIHNRHIGEVFTGETPRDRLERVPAEEVFHLRVIDRWPQTRGEPWLHAVVRKLGDMDGYSEAEIIAARGAASYMGSIETPESSSSVEGETQADGTEQIELTPGIFEKLGPGEKMNWFAPNRPNSALDPFMRYMLREVAAGVGVSYESLSRDYSQSNYSSSRLALLDDRDLWRTLQQWFIRTFREECHREWLRQAVLSRAVKSISVEQYAANPQKFEAVKFKPRGWSWIDPTKEVEAYREAVRCGFTTTSTVISSTGDGRDLEDVIDERRRELDMMAASKLVFDTDPTIPAPSPVAKADPGEAAGGPAASVASNQTPSQSGRVLPITRSTNG